jgi:anti-sigma factor RsiW
MSCDPIRAKLDAYADESCSPQELALIEAHLRDCPDCAAEALGRVQQKRMVRAAGMRFEPSPELRLKIEKSIRKKPTPLWGWLWPDRTRAWTRAWAPGLALAAGALFLAVVSTALWTRHAAREAAVAELLDVHVATLASANPVDVISTDRHTVKPWFQGKLPFTFNLPELQNTPFTLLGGRLMYFRHSAGAQLIYQLRKHQLSVFVLQDQPQVGFPGTEAASEKGFSVESWSSGGLHYVVIGDSNQADIHALSELLRSAARQ